MPRDPGYRPPHRTPERSWANCSSLSICDGPSCSSSALITGVSCCAPLLYHVEGSFLLIPPPARATKRAPRRWEEGATCAAAWRPAGRAGRAATAAACTPRVAACIITKCDASVRRAQWILFVPLALWPSCPRSPWPFGRRESTARLRLANSQNKLFQHIYKTVQCLRLRPWPRMTFEIENPPPSERELRTVSSLKPYALFARMLLHDVAAMGLFRQPADEEWTPTDRSPLAAAGRLSVHIRAEQAHCTCARRQGERDTLTQLQSVDFGSGLC